MFLFRPLGEGEGGFGGEWVGSVCVLVCVSEMAYLALGCPKRYLVREGVVDNNREEEEETERLDGVSVVSVELDRTERYLLTVCGQRVTVWNGQRDRVVLGSLKLHRVGERIVGAVWSANGDRIFAVSFDGVVHVIKVESVRHCLRASIPFCVDLLPLLK